MKLTNSQFIKLQWIQKHGGKAYLEGLHMRAGNDTASAAAAITFLHLVAKGALSAREGHFEITEYGKRLLTP